MNKLVGELSNCYDNFLRHSGFPDYLAKYFWSLLNSSKLITYRKSETSNPGAQTPEFSSGIWNTGPLKWDVNQWFTSSKVLMLQWISLSLSLYLSLSLSLYVYIYIYITGKLKLKTIKNLFLLNGPAKQSRLLKYCILNLLTLSKKIDEKYPIVCEL